MHPSDTIVALATASGKAGVAVLRLSGPKAYTAGLTLTRRETLTPRYAHYSRFYGDDGSILDDGLILYFPAPHSFTGEDVAEVHCHGSLAVTAALLEVCTRLPGCRLAEAGEFTRRALLNGKVDLTYVEGLADLLDADTEKQRQFARLQMAGHFAKVYQEWITAAAQCCALAEAALDFADEDLPPEALQAVTRQTRDLAAAIATFLRTADRAQPLREGFRIALMGTVNAGKSSLLNALAQRDAAIVSPQPGTTRDTIEIRLRLGGYPVVVVDTAGLRHTADTIEQEGIHRSHRAGREADLILWLHPSDTPAPDEPHPLPEDVPVLRVLSKADLPHEHSGHDVAISAVAPGGLDSLFTKLEAHLQAFFGQQAAAAPATLRQRQTLEKALDHLRAAETNTDEVVRAALLRSAWRTLARLTGQADVEKILDIVFQSFCIGK